MDCAQPPIYHGWRPIRRLGNIRRNCNATNTHRRRPKPGNRRKCSDVHDIRSEGTNVRRRTVKIQRTRKGSNNFLDSADRRVSRDGIREFGAETTFAHRAISRRRKKDRPNGKTIGKARNARKDKEKENPRGKNDMGRQHRLAGQQRTEQSPRERMGQTFVLE